VLINASETWVLSKQNEYILAAFKRKILRTIHGAVKRGYEWRVLYNQKLYDLCRDVDVITHIRVGRLKRTGHLIRMNINNQQKSLYSETRRKQSKGRPCRRWVDNTDTDIRTIAGRNLKAMAVNHEKWGRLLRKAMAH
jgi:hypothetical protein